MGFTVAIALVLTVGAGGMDAGTKANIWVAIGTLALAFITWWSLSQTKAVIAAEDRRHQQAFAPLLLLTPPVLSNGRFRSNVYNGGYGLALRVLVMIEGEFSSTELVNMPPTMALQNLPTIAMREDGKVHHIGVVAKDERPEMSFPQPDTRYSIVLLTRVEIEYADMFGNEYKTTYRTFTLNPNDFKWTQPAHLDMRVRLGP